MAYSRIKDFNYKDKEVLVRVDFNVPLDKKGRIKDDKRIKAALPTIKYLIGKGAMVILMSHLGKPKGKVAEGLKMDGVAKRLGRLLKKNVAKLDDCIGQDVEDYIDEMVPGEVVLLENLRFHKEEKENDANFAKSLAELCQIYVNDAFGTCHREHASVAGITKYVPSCAGLLVENEIEKMGKIVQSPKKPFVAIFGFAKLSDKIELMKSLLSKVDKVLLGGLVVFTFLKAQGIEVGKTEIDKSELKTAKTLLKKYKNKIVFPIDIVAAPDTKKRPKTVPVNAIPKDRKGLDMGPKTVKLFSTVLKSAKTVIWNGPLGYFEAKKYAKATNQLANMLAKSKADVVIGGGDTANAVKRYEKRFYHVSTGGGASLEFLSGKKLPAIKALEQNYKKFSR